MAADDGGSSGLKRGFFGFLIAAVGAGGLLVAVYNNNRGDVERRQKALDQLEAQMNRVRAAQVKEHIANVETYRKRLAENQSATFNIGVDKHLRDERMAAEGDLRRAFNKAPNDGELRDCVKRFQQAVNGTVFAPNLDMALRENRKVDRYLDASGDRINELINMGWSEIRIDSARKVVKVFKKPQLQDEKPKQCRAFKGTTG